MFDWLKDLINWLKDELIPFVIITEYERGVLLRLGKAERVEGVYVVRGPGLHWRWPLIDTIITTTVVPTTVDLAEQTVTTRNSVQLVIECSVKYDIIDAAVLLLEVHGAVDALADMSKGIIRRQISALEWPAVNDVSFEKDVLKLINKEAKRWGIRAVAFNVASLAPMRSIRLLQSYAYKNNESTNK